MDKIVISGTGFFIPPDLITNEELVASYNEYVKHYNTVYREAINKGERTALLESSVEFIVKASGIKQRYVVDKKGILDPAVVHPLLPERSNDQYSVQCEMAINAAKQALANANKKPSDIDMVIVSCSNLQRAYPAVAIEVQQALGAGGFAYDMNVGCSSATFGLQAARAAINNKDAKVVLMVNPEICSAHIDFRDRDCHFIFGDACSAVIVEAADTHQSQQAFEIVDCKLLTQFSNNIRNNFGFMNRTAPGTESNRDKLFMQQGRHVFKEVVPLVAKIIIEQLAINNLTTNDIKRFWLHQANINMNHLISHKILGREATFLEAPIILGEYANTASAGSIIAFHQYHSDLKAGELGILTSFGAGYSIGSILLRKI